MTADQYATLIRDCTALAVQSSRSIDDIITDPRGPASHYVGQCDLEFLFGACQAVMQSRAYNQLAIDTYARVN